MIHPAQTTLATVQRNPNAPLVPMILESMTKAMGKVLEPFVQEAIWTSTVLDIFVRGGETRDGRRVFNERDTLGDKISKSFQHAAYELSPFSYAQVLRLTKALTAEGDILSTERGQEVGARILGNYLSTFVVGSGMLKDIYAMISPEYRLLSDNTDVEFLPYALKQATRSFPIEINSDGDGFFERPAQTSPFKTSGIRNHMPLFRQISGLTPEEPKNEVEKEFDRLKIDYVQVAPRKLRDPKGNREARQFVATMVESDLLQYINSPEYVNEKSDFVRKKNLLTRLNAARSLALAYATGAKEWDTDNDIIRKNKARFFRNLSSIERTIVLQDFDDMYGGREVEEDDYGELLNLAKQRDFIK